MAIGMNSNPDPPGEGAITSFKHAFWALATNTR
jgi:hypothetical protein